MISTEMLQDLAARITEKYKLDIKSIQVTNRLTRETKKIEVDISKLRKLAIYGWFWNESLLCYLIFDNVNYYYTLGKDEKRCWIVDEIHAEFFKDLYVNGGSA